MDVQCSATCGQGKQRRNVWCVKTRRYTERGSTELVDSGQCDPLTKPDLVRTCPDLPPCFLPHFKWVPGPWQPVSS